MDTIPANIPLLAPPAGQTSNFHAKDLQPLLIGTHATFLSLMVIVLILRLYVRGIVIRSLWWEDYLVVAAGLITIANSALILTLFDVGYGRHAWNVRLVAVLSGSALKRLSAIAVPYPLAILCIKISVSLLYWRIFSISSRAFRIATLSLIAFCTIFYLANFAYSCAIFGICGSSVTNQATNPNCGVGTQVITWAGGIVNVITDLWLLALPVHPLMKLKMSRRKKVGIWVVFSAGGLASAASIARLVTAITLQGNDDYLYIAAVENVPTTIEMCLGVVAASIPILGKIQESAAFHKVVVVVRSYASTLSLVRKGSLKDSESIQLSTHQTKQDSSQTASI